MSDTQQPETENSVPEPTWPQDGGLWSDDEEEVGMDECGLLQEMVEEDEEIDLYNEETFGLDVAMSAEDAKADSAKADSADHLLLCGDRSPAPPSSPPPSPSAPSPPRARPQIRPQDSVGLRGRGRVQRGRAGRGQMFDDPAVMKTVEGRPSLKSLDSAIVDCGITSYWEDFDSDAWLMSSYGTNRCTAGSILQDQAIVGVIDRSPRGRIPPTSSNFLSPLRPFSPGRGRRGPLLGQHPFRPFSQRCLSPLQRNSMMPGSPMYPQRPFTPQQHYNQSGGFLSPSRPRAFTPQPLSPKMMQLRFGANSPRPAPFYSPSSNPMQRFRFSGPVTQLHPQHKRMLSQRQQRSHRKPDRWDPYSQIMSAKEKEWIIRLQMIQLQSENPHLDDYYYQEYYQRLEAKLAEEELLGDRVKREPPKLTTPYVTKTNSYTPVVHIEGSLGQVTVSTCFSPRRAIDAIHAHTPDEEQKDPRQQRLDVLNNIEKLFMVLLEVEEAERMKGAVPAEEEERRLLENMQRRVEFIYTQLRFPNTQLHFTNTLVLGEEFLPCLLVSKGKRLLARLLPFLSHDAALHVLGVVTSHLPTLMSRDSDEALPVLYPSLRTVIGGLSFSQLIGVLKEFTSSMPDSKETRLMLACQNKFGLSLLYALLSQGERLLSSDLPMQPTLGDFETWTDTVFQVARQLSQTSLVEPLLLPSNLLTLFCRYLDKRTVHQLKSNIESATGYLAVAS